MDLLDYIIELDAAKKRTQKTNLKSTKKQLVGNCKIKEQRKESAIMKLGENNDYSPSYWIENFFV